MLQTARLHKHTVNMKHSSEMSFQYFYLTTVLRYFYFTGVFTCSATLYFHYIHVITFVTSYFTDNIFKRTDFLNRNSNRVDQLTQFIHVHLWISYFMDTLLLMYI